MFRLGAISSPAATWSSTAAVGFDQRNDDVGPEPGQPLALGEHRIGLPHTGNRSQVDVQPTS